MSDTFDARTYVHCSCGGWVQESPRLEVSSMSKTSLGNARCAHRDDLIHFKIERTVVPYARYSTKR